MDEIVLYNFHEVIDACIIPVLVYLGMFIGGKRANYSSEVYLRCPIWLERIIFPIYYMKRKKQCSESCQLERSKWFPASIIGCSVAVITLVFTALYGIGASLVHKYMQGSIIFFVNLFLCGLASFGGMLWGSILDYSVSFFPKERQKKLFFVVLSALEFLAIVFLALALWFGWL